MCGMKKKKTFAALSSSFASLDFSDSSLGDDVVASAVAWSIFGIILL